MISVAEKIRPIIQNQKSLIVSAQVLRAEESAQIIARELQLPQPQSFVEFYAAEEEGELSDPEGATKLITNLGNQCEVLIVIASRECIETIPQHILENHESYNLKRGEALLIDWEKRTVRYI